MTTYAEQVARRLDEVYRTNSLPLTREIDQLRLILVSDLHKGRRDEADDFQQCELAYLAALQTYWRNGFELWLLGDIEELWENFARPVIAAYDNVLSREQAFAEASPGRYVRLVGNHDDQWYDPQQVQKHLQPYLGGHGIVEGVRLTVTDQGRPLGELFLVHGHQGTLDSDRYAGLSAWFVRTIWRPIQRLLRIKSSTPSNDFRLKQLHELAMYQWAAKQSGLVLCAGHTHHPVWEGLSYQQAMEQRIQAEDLPSDTEKSWIQAEIGGQIELPGEKPSYFNTGCCSYSDGSCTGLEIEDGEIRLIRWSSPSPPTREVLFKAQLADVLAAVAR